MANQLFCSYSTAIGWLQNNLIPCLFKKLTGIDCPLCGLQRSIIALLKGDIMASFKYYPATLLLLLLLIMGIAGERTILGRKPWLKKGIYTTTLLLISCSYLLKLAGVFNN